MRGGTRCRSSPGSPTASWQDLDPPRPGDAHRRRYLHLSRLPDGSLLGRFACGPAQALTLTTVLAALAGPRPGKAIDADGVERDLPDERTPAERRMDALAEAVDHNHRTCHCRHTHTHRGATTAAGAAGFNPASAADGTGTRAHSNGHGDETDGGDVQHNARTTAAGGSVDTRNVRSNAIDIDGDASADAEDRDAVVNGGDATASYTRSETQTDDGIDGDINGDIR